MAAVKYTVRVMTEKDVPQVLECWKEIELSEGTHTLYSWLKVDKEGIYVAETEDGEIIGACCAIFHEDAELYFVGIYIVKEKHRGTGVGKKVWDACMEHIGSSNAVINAVPGKEALYRDKGGFPISEPDWNIGVYQSQEPVNHEALSDQIPDGVVILPFDESLLNAIFEYDQSIMGYKRRLALELSCKEDGCKTFVGMKDGKCVGFGSIRISILNMGQVGPLYADTPNVAEALLKNLIVSLPEVKGFAMMPLTNNKCATELLEKIGAPFLEECPRFYRGKKWNVDNSKVFGQFNCNFSPY